MGFMQSFWANFKEGFVEAKDEIATGVSSIQSGDVPKGIFRAGMGVVDGVSNLITLGGAHVVDKAISKSVESVKTWAKSKFGKDDAGIEDNIEDGVQDEPSLA